MGQNYINKEQTEEGETRRRKKIYHRSKIEAMNKKKYEDCIAVHSLLNSIFSPFYLSSSLSLRTK